MLKRLSAASVAVLCACGPAEVRVGEGKIPKIEGDQTFTLGQYTCGNPITAQGYTVSTRSINGDADCEFTFDQLVEVIRAADYQNIPDLQGASNLVQKVELRVEALAFVDASNNMPLDYNGYVKTLALNVDGQQVADKSTLASLPTTVALTGAALTNIKTRVDARQPASVHATAIMVVPKSPAPPPELKVTYKAQPTVVLGPGNVSLPQ
ncbi:MAG: hypothetical protein JNK82_23490 [Myxococcaceae bacterium]|nr:hypothetical protein [Myxococcaceae bacterium]